MQVSKIFLKYCPVQNMSIKVFKFKFLTTIITYRPTVYCIKKNFDLKQIKLN